MAEHPLFSRLCSLDASFWLTRTGINARTGQIFPPSLQLRKNFLNMTGGAQLSPSSQNPQWCHWRGIGHAHKLLQVPTHRQYFHSHFHHFFHLTIDYKLCKECTEKSAVTLWTDTAFWIYRPQIKVILILSFFSGKQKLVNPLPRTKQNCQKRPGKHHSHAFVVVKRKKHLWTLIAENHAEDKCWKLNWKFHEFTGHLHQAPRNWSAWTDRSYPRVYTEYWTTERQQSHADNTAALQEAWMTCGCPKQRRETPMSWINLRDNQNCH